MTISVTAYFEGGSKEEITAIDDLGRSLNGKKDEWLARTDFIAAKSSDGMTLNKNGFWK